MLFANQKFGLCEPRFLSKPHVLLETSHLTIYHQLCTPPFRPPQCLTPLPNRVFPPPPPSFLPLRFHACPMDKMSILPLNGTGHPPPWVHPASAYSSPIAPSLIVFFALKYSNAPPYCCFGCLPPVNSSLDPASSSCEPVAHFLTPCFLRCFRLPLLVQIMACSPPSPLSSRVAVFWISF